MLHSPHVAIALQREPVSFFFDDTMQDVVPGGNLSEDGISHVVGVSLLKEDTVSSMLDKRPHTISLHVDGIGFAFPEHLRHFAQPSIVGQLMTGLNRNDAIALAVMTAQGSPGLSVFLCMS